MKNLTISIIPGLICYIVLTYLQVQTFSINLSFLVSNIILFLASLLSSSFYYYLEKKESRLIPLFFLFFSIIILVFNLSSSFVKWRFSQSRSLMVKNVNVSDVKKSIKENDFIYYNQLSKIPSWILIKYAYVLLGGIIAPKIFSYKSKKTFPKKHNLGDINIKYSTLIFLLFLSLKVINLFLNDILKTNYLNFSELQIISLYFIKSLVDIFSYLIIVLIGFKSFKSKDIDIANIFILSGFFTIIFSILNNNSSILILLYNSVINFPTISALIVLGLYLKNISFSLKTLFD